MPLALFDLDNTLLSGDSDHAWGDWLCRRGVLDAAAYRARNDAYYADYQAGELDIAAYLDFCLAVLGRHERTRLEDWHREFMAECVEPIILAKGEALLTEHRAAGDRLVIITATNRFVAAPIAARLGVDALLATECETRGGQYTGRSCDTPCFREGKVLRLERWLLENGMGLDGSTFYSDSHNDLPLLERVERPVAVDPCPRLRAIAERRGWPVRSLRD